jgi:hypothetical protein
MDRGNMSNQKKDGVQNRLSAGIKIRLTHEDRARLDAHAKAKGVGPSQMAREDVLDGLYWRDEEVRKGPQ